MSARPKVSVVIVSYNNAAFVGTAIQSVLDQTYKDFEILVADDASTDGSQDIISRFTDERVRLILRERNIGLCRNFNHALTLARGEYVAFLACDDLFMPTKLEKQMRIMESNPDVMMCFTYVDIIDECSKSYKYVYQHMKRGFNMPSRHTREQWLNFLFYPEGNLSYASALARKEVIKRVGDFDERLLQTQDYEHLVRTVFAGNTIAVIEEILTGYRFYNRVTNLSATTIPMVNRQGLECQHMLSHFLEIQTLEEFCKIFPEAIIPSASDDLVPFYLAQQALKVNEAPYREFAARILFQLFANPIMVAKLEKECHFTLQDFYKITGNVGAHYTLKTYFTYTVKPRIKPYVPFFMIIFYQWLRRIGAKY